MTTTTARIMSIGRGDAMAPPPAADVDVVGNDNIDVVESSSPNRDGLIFFNKMESPLTDFCVVDTPHFSCDHISMDSYLAGDDAGT